MTGTVDVEPALVAWTNTALSVRCVTELPADLEAVLPIIDIGRIGGPTLVVGLDAATVDVTCYGASRINARALAYRLMDAYIRQLPGSVVTGGIVTRVQVVSGPTFHPYENTAVRRFGATYRIVTQATT